MRYRGTAIVVGGPVTPPDYLKRVAPAPLNMGDQLLKVREILFNPSVLEAAAREVKGYRDVPGKLPLRVLDEFKTNINVKIDNEHSFQLTYDSPDRYEAMNVTNKLADLLVKGASAQHEQKDEEAESVINDQIEKVTKGLEQQGKQLHDYKA